MNAQPVGRRLAYFAVAVVLGHHLGTALGPLGGPGHTRWADWVDLAVPYVVVGTAAATLARSGPDRAAFRCLGPCGAGDVCPRCWSCVRRRARRLAGWGASWQNFPQFSGRVDLTDRGSGSDCGASSRRSHSAPSAAIREPDSTNVSRVPPGISSSWNSTSVVSTANAPRRP